jgi:hypothetical protein
MNQVIEALLFLLLERDLLELTPGSTMKELVNETIRTMKKNSELIQFGAWFGNTLMSSKHVEELYATDEDLSALIKEL